MKKLIGLLLLLLAVPLARGATATISDLPQVVAPSANSWFLVQDMGLAPQNRKLSYPDFLALTLSNPNMVAALAANAQVTNTMMLPNISATTDDSPYFSLVLIGDSVMRARVYDIMKLATDTWGLRGIGLGETSCTYSNAAAEVTGAWTTWINGIYNDIPAGGSATWWYNNSHPIYCDRATVYYIMEPGGGTFDIRASSLAGDAWPIFPIAPVDTWSTISAGVSCADVATIGAAITVNLTSGFHRVQTLGATGNCKIIGVSMWHSGIKGAVVCSLAQDGHEITSWVNCPAAIYTPILSDLGQCLYMCEWKEANAALSAVAVPVLEGMLRAATPASDFIYSTAFPTIGADTQVAAFAAFLRNYARTSANRIGLYDGYSRLTPAAAAAPFYADAVHLNAAGLLYSTTDWWMSSPLYATYSRNPYAPRWIRTSDPVTFANWESPVTASTTTQVRIDAVEKSFAALGLGRLGDTYAKVNITLAPTTSTIYPDGLAIYSAAANQVLGITQAGDVKIGPNLQGLTAPAAKLDVVGAATFSGALTNASTHALGTSFFQNALFLTGSAYGTDGCEFNMFPTSGRQWMVKSEAGTDSNPNQFTIKDGNLNIVRMRFQTNAYGEVVVPGIITAANAHGGTNTLGPTAFTGGVMLGGVWRGTWANGDYITGTGLPGSEITSGTVAEVYLPNVLTNEYDYYGEVRFHSASTPQFDSLQVTNNITVGGVLTITPTNWVDSMVPALSVTVGGTAPTLSAFNSGPSVLFFDDNQDDYVYFTVQLNHNYLEGSTIEPHIHIAQTAADTAKESVWQLIYQWGNVDAVPAGATLLVTNTISGTQWKHQLVEFPAITGAGKTVSSILICQLKRLANSATADNATQGMAFLGFDVHYRIGQLGSIYENSTTVP